MPPDTRTGADVGSVASAIIEGSAQSGTGAATIGPLVAPSSSLTRTHLVRVVRITSNRDRRNATRSVTSGSSSRHCAVSMSSRKTLSSRLAVIFKPSKCFLSLSAVGRMEGAERFETGALLVL
ncbi:MAG: hypothetical protein IPK13_05230 [Deltaproteobacteria bacterium]|nr:hypothetical protein [Deltaproteobacteria bacterium]